MALESDGNCPPDAAFALEVEGHEPLVAYRWLPRGPAKAVLCLVHGMGEHARRYGRFARGLTERGVAVYAHDQRGHGQLAMDEGLLGHFADADGFRLVVDDIDRLRLAAMREHDGLPVIYFGHSMGALLGQEYLIRHSDHLAAAILSGTGGGQGPLLAVGKLVAWEERHRLGPRAHSAIIDQLSFGAYNRAFSHARTEYDWLSRDPTEVDAYLADPLCGGTLTTQSWFDFFRGLQGIERKARQDLVSKDLPVYIFAGDADPVGNRGKGPLWLESRYRSAGMRSVSLRLYPGGRHEMLNELNRAQVIDDLWVFLQSVLG